MSEYIWVGLDVHVDSITAAVLERHSDDSQVLTLSGELHKVRRLFRRLSRRDLFVHVTKLSGAGFVLHRRLKQEKGVQN